jgi:DNA primase
VTHFDGVGHVDAVELLEQLDVKNVRRIGRGEVEFSCPFVDGHSYGDMNPSNHMNEEKLVYRCKSCGRRGTAIDLIGYVLKCSPLEALRWLRSRFGETRVFEEGEVARLRRQRLERWNSLAQGQHRLPLEQETIHGIFAVDWWSDDDAAVYMRERGFPPAAMSAWGFGYDSWTSRVTIPIRDEHGSLVGFKGRAIHPWVARRYDVIGDVLEGDHKRKLRYGVGYGFGLYDARQVVFGIHNATSRRLVVCEGELNAFAARCAGEGSSVAIGTTTVTREQMRLLRWRADELVIFYDSDEAGRGATWGYYATKGEGMIWIPGLVEKLSPYLPIYVVPDHEGDAASMDPADVRELIRSAESWRAIALR